MYILVTDILTCPGCGPWAGLVLLAERLEERRVLEGALGCAKCRTRYPIRAGFADLRVPPATPDQAAAAAGVPAAIPDEASEDAVRLLAFLGVMDGPAHVLVVGPAAVCAPAMADHVGGLEVIAAHPPLRDVPERHGVTRIGVGAVLPFFARSLRGVVLSGAAADPLLEEGIRIVRPGGRLVVAEPSAQAITRSETAGMRVIAADPAWLIATPA